MLSFAVLFISVLHPARGRPQSMSLVLIWGHCDTNSWLPEASQAAQRVRQWTLLFKHPEPFLLGWPIGALKGLLKIQSPLRT